MEKKWHIAVNSKEGRGLTGREHRVIAEVIYMTCQQRCMPVSCNTMLCTDCLA
jgi:hypothetical protein